MVEKAHSDQTTGKRAPVAELVALKRNEAGVQLEFFGGRSTENGVAHNTELKERERERKRHSSFLILQAFFVFKRRSRCLVNFTLYSLPI